jgi:CRP-like cAMP-binding protein/cytochrome P450
MQSGRALPAPPRKPGLPIVGNTLQVMRDPEAFLLDAYHEYGPVFTIRLGLDDFTVLIGDEARAFFLRVGERGLDREPFYGRFARELGCEYFVLSEPQGGGRHARLRRMMKLGFSRECCAPYVPDMVRAVRATAAGWTPGRLIPVMDATARLTFQLYGLVMADRDLSPVFEDARRYAQTIMMIGARMAPLVSLRVPRYRRAKAAVFALMRDLVDDALRRDPERGAHLTVVQALLQAYDGDDLAPEARAEVISAALYGFVGTIMYMNRAVSFLLYELARNPGTMDAATREADAAFAAGPVTAETLRRLVYIRAAFNESLRRHPVAIGLPFGLAEDVEFDGRVIRADELILISHVLGHFDPEHFRDPWKFEPERFLPPRNEHRTKGVQYAPFGFGGRACTAVGLVETIVLATVATLLHTVAFELETPAYRLRATVNPLPGPEKRFRLRIVERRTPAAAAGSLPAFEEGDALEEPASTERVAGALERLQLREFGAGAVILRQGDPADGFYVLVEGEVAVSKTQAGGQDTEVARLRPGAHFGELGLLRGAPRNATIRCTEPSRVLAMDRGEFLSLVADVDVLSADIALLARRRFVADRLRRAMPRLGGAEIEAFADQFRLERVPPHTLVLRQGEPAETFHVLAGGSVEVVLETADGERFLTRRGPGEYFGEIGLVMRRPRMATVRTQEDGADLLTMDRAAFQNLFASSQATMDEMLLRLIQRLGESFDVGGSG